MTESRRASLETLTENQRDCLTDLHSGFKSREKVLLWQQRVAVRSLGMLPDKWFPAVAMRPDILDALVGDDSVDEFRRGQLGDIALHRAFREAFHQTRNRATEYTSAEDDEKTEAPDGTRQKHLVMRPELTAVDDKQETALVAMFDGFRDREAIRLWVEDLRQASEGQIPASFLQWAVYNPAGLDPLTAPPDDGPARAARENIAATILLPAFNRGIREVFADASEQPEEGQQQNHDTFMT
jgi:hypothetical protein